MLFFLFNDTATTEIYTLSLHDALPISLLAFIDASEVREEDENFKNAVDYIFEALEKEKPNHFAVKQYKKYKLAAGKTAKSILISCGARLAPFDIEELRNLMKYDEMGLNTIGDKKTALFIIISRSEERRVGKECRS